MPTVLITGGTGLLGSRLSELLHKEQYKVIHLSRSKNLKARFPAYYWNPATGEIDEQALAQADHIILLAGAGIVDKRWTDSRKRLLIDSRVKGNLLVAKTIKALKLQPASVVAASAIGYYGDSGAELLDENARPGSGFLTECTVAWEDSLLAFQEMNTRLTMLRIGVVFSASGGALEKLYLPFRFGMGNYFGSGSQYYSWVHIDDMCRMMIFAIENENIRGIFNAVGPNPATLKTIIHGIKKATNSRALIMPVPELTIKLAMGERASMVLGSTRVSSRRIAGKGFDFQYPDLVPALKDLFERKI